jgi:hypothetical protein
MLGAKPGGLKCRCRFRSFHVSTVSKQSAIFLALARLEAQILSKNGRSSAVVPDSYAAFAATTAICNPRRRPPVQGAIRYRRFHSVRRTLCAAVSSRPGSGGFSNHRIAAGSCRATGSPLLDFDSQLSSISNAGRGFCIINTHTPCTAC